MKEEYTRDEIEYLLEQDENGAFVRLIIPKNVPYKCEEFKDELNLIGKLPKDYKIDEIQRAKAFSHLLWARLKKD